MGQCSDRLESKSEDDLVSLEAWCRPDLVCLEKAKSLSSNAMVTATRYHSSSGSRKLEDDYVVSGKVLGSGICGNVVLANSRVDRRRYALKTINKARVSAKKLDQLSTEVEIYLSLDHPNIARLQDVYETGEKIQLLTECCEGGELYYRLQKRGVYSDADAADAMRQMLRAVSYLHSRDIVHRDLKLENLLYVTGQSSQLKLIDFGFARIWDPSTLMMTSCGSVAYVSPDVISGKGYTNKCDMWSLGVIIWMLLTGYPPFHGDEKTIVAKIRTGKPDWSHKQRWKNVSQPAMDLVQKLLAFDPNERLSAREALQHPWLSGQAPSPLVLRRDLMRSLHCYSEASKVRRAALQLMARELTLAEAQELQEMFLALDPCGHGTVSLHELKNAIRGGGRAALGASPVNAAEMSPATPARRLCRADSGAIDELCGMLDANGDDRISCSDFLAAALDGAARARNRDLVMRATFSRLDADRSGTIGAEDLRTVIGDTFEGAGVEELMAEVAPSDSQGISYPAFVSLLEGRGNAALPARATAVPARSESAPDDPMTPVVLRGGLLPSQRSPPAGAALVEPTAGGSVQTRGLLKSNPPAVAGKVDA
jgi:calcium-dependent protein kinase